MLYRAEFRPSFENGPERGHSGIAAVKNLVANEPEKLTSELATVVIATRNRKDDLRRAIASCMLQVPRVTVLVLDDGSTDGTAENGCEEFSAAVAIGELARHLCTTKPRGGDGRDAFHRLDRRRRRVRVP
jgi:Glycosyl transferase family 2